MDQALWQAGTQGRRLGYGGDFGERPTDYAFSANGIVFADGEEKPAMQDLRYWYDTPAGRAAHDARNAKEAAAFRLPALRAGGPLTVIEGDVNLGVEGDGFALQFSYAEGGLASLRKAGGPEWVWRAPRPALWRAATENDKGCGFPVRSAAWMAADAFPKAEGWQVEEKSSQQVRIRYNLLLPHRAGGLGRPHLHRHRQRPAGGRHLPRRARRARAARLWRADVHPAARRPGLLDRPFGRNVPRPL